MPLLSFFQQVSGITYNLQSIERSKKITTESDNNPTRKKDLFASLEEYEGELDEMTLFLKEICGPIEQLE